MIEYTYPEEKVILLYYAKTLGHKNIEAPLSKSQIESPIEAKELAHFFWIWLIKQ